MDNHHDILIKFNQDIPLKNAVLNTLRTGFNLNHFDQSKNNEQLGEELRAKLQAIEMFEAGVAELETHIDILPTSTPVNPGL